MAEHLKTGSAGEDLAVRHLIRAGYTVLFRNYRYRRAEVDIIAQKEKVLVFVEVKTRVSDINGWPEESVTAKKERLLLMAADAYLHRTNWPHEVRFDIIAITGVGNERHVHHIEDAFH